MFLDREGARLHYTTTNANASGTPILLTHGFGASGEMWQPQLEILSKERPVITWDMRGHGQTECPDDPALFSHDHCFKDIAALLDHLEFDQAIVGGHSLGGYMSQGFYAGHADRVVGLYLQACGPGYRSAEPRAIWNKRAHDRAAQIEESGIDAIEHGPEVAISVRGTARSLAHVARGMLTQVDARAIDNLPNISVPVLIIVGDRDSNFLDGTAYMQRRIPNARRLVIEGAGHGVNVEEPGIVTEALNSFSAGL